jgi:hypothetical protein
VKRLAPGCGAVLVSSGIPLPPGKLKPEEISRLHLFVGGAEPPLYMEALSATHADGTLRSVLVQFSADLPAVGTAVAGQLVLGTPRTAAALAKPTADRGSPAAVVLPSDPSYLVSTQLVGPTVPVTGTTAFPAIFQKYETDFRPAADNLWTLNGGAWTENYYDRALIYYAWWVRTGDVTYWQRATAMAVNYRRDYLEASNYGPSAHWYQPEGVEAHYLLTGDEASRTALGASADVFSVAYYMNYLQDLTAEMDNRMQARVLLAYLTAQRVHAPSRQGLVWTTLLPDALTKILASQQASGAYGFTRTNNQCGYNKPFMVGLLNDALIKYATTYQDDPRIQPAVQKAVDYLWAHDWDTATQAFMYLDGPCPGYDGPPAPDLNNLVVVGFGWLYARTGTVSYRTAGDQVFAGAVTGAWLAGSKQFNQQYYDSYRYLFDRR